MQRQLTLQGVGQHVTPDILRDLAKRGYSFAHINQEEFDYLLNLEEPVQLNSKVVKLIVHSDQSRFTNLFSNTKILASNSQSLLDPYVEVLLRV